MKRIKIRTPENIDIEYRLAGLGSRVAAAGIDMLIQLIGMFIIGLTLFLFARIYFDRIEEYQGWFIAGGIILVAVINYGYFIIFELTMNGRTLGKRLLGLRVIRNNGQPITFKHSIIRNLFRLIVDYYGVGVILILFTKQYKRVGDYAASTIVIAEEKEEILNTLNNDIDFESNPRFILEKEEYRLLRDYFTRYESMGENAKNLERKLGEYFTHKFGVEKREDEYDMFLKELIQK